MKYRYREKSFCHGSYELIPMEPGDQWIVEGVVRFHLPALLIDIEEKPEQFTLGQIAVADYAEDAIAYAESRVADWFDEEEDDDIAEPVVVVEYGPDDWRVIDGWMRIARAVELEMEYLPAIKLPEAQTMKYLVAEEDVRRYIENWNFKAAYWERRDRINGFLQEDRPEYTEIHVDAEATWEAILAAANGRYIDIPIRWNRWFSIHGNGKKVWICEAQHMAPVCQLTFDRPVRKQEFMDVFALYEEWEMAADETDVRERARDITISYEYIFGMIRQYATEKKCDILSAESVEESYGDRDPLAGM